jgi:Zn-dependent protease
VFIEYLTKDPVFYVTALTCIVVSVSLHELGHVFAALRQGDDTPRIMGHVTIDPLVHMGMSGLMLAALAGISFGSTPVNPNAFRGRFGRAYVAFSGPLVNLSLALIAFTGLALWVRHAGPGAALERNNLVMFVELLGRLNLLLLMFNMIPLPPLDGGEMLASVWPALDEIKHRPEAQPWLWSGVLAVGILLGPRLMELTHDIGVAYIRLWQ